jgi:hypothetical protein
MTRPPRTVAIRSLDNFVDLVSEPVECLRMLRDEQRQRWRETHGEGVCACSFVGAEPSPARTLELCDACRTRWRLCVALELVTHAAELKADERRRRRPSIAPPPR